MVNNFMSIEEFCEEAMFVIRPLPWWSFKVTEFFGRLDMTSQTLHSCQSRKMRNKRDSGEPSERPCPIAKYGKSLLWASAGLIIPFKFQQPQVLVTVKPKLAAYIHELAY